MKAHYHTGLHLTFIIRRLILVIRLAEKRERQVCLFGTHPLDGDAVRQPRREAALFPSERLASGVVEIEGVRGTRAGMFTMTTPASGHDPAGEKPALTFQRSETQYRLATTWTSGNEGFAIAGR